jgi:hypothetical protein
VSFDYSRTIETADRLITRYGQVGAIRKLVNTGKAYDPTQTLEDTSVTLAVLEYEDSKLDRGPIRTGDKQVFVSAKGLPISIKPTDKCVIGGEQHDIVNVKPLAPAGTVVMYQLQVRQ